MDQFTLLPIVPEVGDAQSRIAFFPFFSIPSWSSGTS
jgi:hypothetical protein